MVNKAERLCVYMLACMCVCIPTHYDLSLVYWRHTFQESEQPLPVIGEIVSYFLIYYSPFFLISKHYDFLNIEIINHPSKPFFFHLLKKRWNTSFILLCYYSNHDKIKIEGLGVKVRQKPGKIFNTKEKSTWQKERI